MSVEDWRYINFAGSLHCHGRLSYYLPLYANCRLSVSRYGTAISTHGRPFSKWHYPIRQKPTRTN